MTILQNPKESFGTIIKVLMGTVKHPAFAVKKRFVDPKDTPWYMEQLQYSKIREITTGIGGKVAIIDNGIDDLHKEIFGKVIVRWDTTGEGPKAGSHGTFVAGEIAGKEYGLFPDMLLGDFKALTAREGVGATKWVADCTIQAHNKGFEVINASLGTNEPDLYLEKAICTFCKNGKNFFVCASGNDGTNNYDEMSTDFPAQYSKFIPGVISVGAAGFDNGHLYIPLWSSKGVVTLVAPAVDILSCLPNREYGIMSGTSMAAPLVAGTIAAMKAMYEEFTHEDFDNLLQVCTPIQANKNQVQGAGFINIVDMLTMVKGWSNGDPKPKIQPKVSKCPIIRWWQKLRKYFV